MPRNAGDRAMIEDALRTAIARMGPLRGAVKSRYGQHLVQTARGAGVVREPVRFAARQLGPWREGDYRLRQSGLRIFLRHENVPLTSHTPPPSTGDVHILNEIFGATGGQYAYQPPPALAAAFTAKPPLKVMDLGANIGLFGADALGRWPRAQIRSFEPDPANLRLLTRVVAANGLEDRWSVEDVAVANYTGEMSFVAGLFADSHLATAADPSTSEPADGQSLTVRTVDIFERDHDVDVMKMDIEGGEWAILCDPRLPELKADVIVLEWHALGCPEADPRQAASGLLRAAGYDRIEDVEVGTYNGVLWAWRGDAAPG
jgi:FkbM family methyltransferase